jgi:hypothetical protein
MRKQGNVVPGFVEQYRQARRIWDSLSWMLPGVPRPTPAEIEADLYDGSVPISEWLARNTHELTSCLQGPSVEMSAGTVPMTGCFSASSTTDGQI